MVTTHHLYSDYILNLVKFQTFLIKPSIIQRVSEHSKINFIHSRNGMENKIIFIFGILLCLKLLNQGYHSLKQKIFPE